MTSSAYSHKSVNFNACRRVILTIAGGGFFWQSKCIAKGLEGCVDFHYLTPDDITDHVDRGLPPGKFYHVSRITTYGDRVFWRKVLNTITSFYDTYRIMKEVQPHAVICVASPIALPICFWAKCLRKTSIFVESITRVNNPSATGKLLSIFKLCDRLYVQWPEAEKLYPGARYRGTVL